MNIVKYIYLLLLAFAGNFFSMHAMQNPAKTELPTKFEQFQFEQLPNELQILILTISAESDNLPEAIESIRRNVLLNKKWEAEVNSEYFTNQLVNILLKNKNIQNFFDEVALQELKISDTFAQKYMSDSMFKLILKYPKNAPDSIKKLIVGDENRKILLLALLGTKQAQQMIQQIDKEQVKQALLFAEKLIHIIWNKSAKGETIENLETMLYVLGKIADVNKKLYGNEWFFKSGITGDFMWIMKGLAQNPEYSSVFKKYFEAIPGREML